MSPPDPGGPPLDGAASPGALRGPSFGDRVAVVGACASRCYACFTCGDEPFEAPLEAALAKRAAADLFLGGGDATRWRFLRRLLEHNQQRDPPQRIWVEAPAAAFTAAVLDDLAALGAFGVRVQVEGAGPTFLRRFGLGDGETTVAEAERRGLATEIRIVLRPLTFPILVPLARRFRPRRVWVELARQDVDAPPTTIPAAAVEAALLAADNLYFSAQRDGSRGYLPPCAMPRLWDHRPGAWQPALGGGGAANQATAACPRCTLRQHCRWDDPGALSPPTLARLTPVEVPVRRQASSGRALLPSPAAADGAPRLLCHAPWTTLEIVDPDGLARQCCSGWTVGARGQFGPSSLAEIWNGPGYRRARQAMSGGDRQSLCRPICPRLHDGRLAGERLTFTAGSPAFEENQRLLAEDLSARRDLIRARPLAMALCPTTYCNYNCIMCEYGRTPRRDLHERVWEELPAFLPTLRTLTLLGGEPLASPRAWQFLRELDVKRCPDLTIDLITNGSLLTPQALAGLRDCPFGDITVSVNAGTAEAYARIQRPSVAFAELLAHIDALIAFRSRRPSWFGITLSFVVQPAASASLVDFALLAHSRNLPIRLLPLDTGACPELDFYGDGPTVEAMVADLDRLAAWARRPRGEWLTQIRGVRAAIVDESRRRSPPLVPLGRAPAP